MRRREFSAKVKVEAYRRSRGRCEACTAHLSPRKFHYDHVIPDALGGLPTLENVEVLCVSCHGAKTAGQDVPRIAKAKRQEIKHVGASRSKSRPIPGSKASGLKKRMDGTVERRKP